MSNWWYFHMVIYFYCAVHTLLSIFGDLMVALLLPSILTCKIWHLYRSKILLNTCLLWTVHADYLFFKWIFKYFLSLCYAPLLLTLLRAGDMKVSALQPEALIVAPPHVRFAVTYCTAQQALTQLPVLLPSCRWRCSTRHPILYGEGWPGSISCGSAATLMCYEMGVECALQEKRKCRRLQSFCCAVNCKITQHERKTFMSKNNCDECMSTHVLNVWWSDTCCTFPTFRFVYF